MKSDPSQAKGDEWWLTRASSLSWKLQWLHRCCTRCLDIQTTIANICLWLSWQALHQWHRRQWVQGNSLAKQAPSWEEARKQWKHILTRHRHDRCHQRAEARKYCQDQVGWPELWVDKLAEFSFWVLLAAPSQNHGHVELTGWCSRTAKVFAEDFSRAMKIVHGTVVASGIKVEGYEEWLATLTAVTLIL